MKKTIILIITLLPLAVFAQLPFSVSGLGKAFNNGDKIYLTYKANNKVMFDSATVANHTFLIRGTVDGISKGALYKNENPMVLEIVRDVADLYIEPGDIVITSQDSLNNAVLSGTSTNIDYTELYTKLKPLHRKLANESQKFDALTPVEQKDINNIAAMRARVKEINNEMAPIQLEFVKKYPNSYISVITLRQMIYNPALLPQINEAYKTLTPAIRESVTGKQLEQTIVASINADIGQIAVNFTLPGANGKQVKLSDFKGKYVLIDFWASWCLPCRQENPNVMLAYNKYKNKGFTVLGVSIDNMSEKKAWLKAIKDDGITWPQVLDYKAEKEKVKTLYGITTIPANVLIDPSGKIVAKNIKDKVLLNKLDELIGRR